ncbi:MAG TPA: hypothetical protein VG248_08080 [Caulobacteraceae bacterium]|jgi:hypothetical protein|nr:hypothetical protein [Caulobacteraceae bacterium]
MNDDALERLAVKAPRDIAADIRDGDLLLCAAHDPFSRLIGWATHSPWTHVAIAWRWPEAGEVLVLECVQHLGVRAVTLDRFVRETSSGVRPYPGKIVLARRSGLHLRAPRDALVAAGLQRLGDRFSGAEIAKIALRIVAGRLQRRTPRPLRPRDEFICSEYVDACFKAAGIEFPWDGLGFIAPCDIARDAEVEGLCRLKTR